MSLGLSRVIEANERWEVISVWIVTHGMREKEVVQDSCFGVLMFQGVHSHGPRCCRAGVGGACWTPCSQVASASSALQKDRPLPVENPARASVSGPTRLGS